jgi:hypothetical protein
MMYGRAEFDITWVHVDGSPVIHITEPARWGCWGWVGVATTATLCLEIVERRDHNTLSVSSGYYRKFIGGGIHDWMPETLRDLNENTCGSCVFALGQLLRGEP